MFSQHINGCRKKAARQCNALAPVSKHLNINSRRTIYNSFIMSNLTYCPLVWHFCGKINNQTLEQIQENALRILFPDYNSSYLGLLNRAGTTTLLMLQLRLTPLFVFKSLHGLNPPCLKALTAIVSQNFWSPTNRRHYTRLYLKLPIPRFNNIIPCASGRY